MASFPESSALFKNAFQRGILSIFRSIGRNPLQIWKKQVSGGRIKTVADREILSDVLEITGRVLSVTHITCPSPGRTLGIKLPFVILMVKNLEKEFSFEVQVMDDQNIQRRFRASNCCRATQVSTFCCMMPLTLKDGWNEICFNLSYLTKKCYGTNYLEAQRVQINANCHVRRVFFSERLYSEEQLPSDFYFPSTFRMKCTRILIMPQ